MDPNEVMIVGQSPDSTPLDAESGKRLAQFFGLETISELSKHCPFVNLSDSYKVAEELHAIRPIVLLCGKTVAGACGVLKDYFEPTPWRGGTAVVIPHPSPLNSWWTDQKNSQIADEFFAEAGVVMQVCPRFSGKRFKNMIALKGETQISVARGIRRGKATIWRWINEQTTPDANDLFAMTWFLRCDPSELAE